jgi:hypothetical protein
MDTLFSDKAIFLQGECIFFHLGKTHPHPLGKSSDLQSLGGPG